MQPNIKHITIKNNISKIKQLLYELVLEPRGKAIKWSRITKQTPNIKIGYPGQHLASLIAGMEGERTGARGNDLVDGSEVKSCSRIDQLDKCVDCEAPISRLETICPQCGSSKIKRNNDSKWLFTIRNEDDLNLITTKVKRIILVIGDYPNFDKADYETLRFQSFEIWPQHPRHSKFVEIMTNYYYKIYLSHKKQSPEKTPAPKNFWPYTYQFYLCNPILTFSCIIYNTFSKPNIIIKHYIKPYINRRFIISEVMPSTILKTKEIDKILRKAKRSELKKVSHTGSIIKITNVKKSSLREKKAFFTGIDEKLRKYLELRDTDKISSSKKKYSRRGIVS